MSRAAILGGLALSARRVCRQRVDHIEVRIELSSDGEQRWVEVEKK